MSSPSPERGQLQRFSGATAVVTGGAAGIGAASARRLAAEGARVLIADIDDRAGTAVADQLRERGHDATFVHCDVSHAADWGELVRLVRSLAGRLDVLHSNAYMEIPGAAHELAEEDWDRQLAVTLKGAYLGVGSFAGMLADARGAVVISSSVHALVGLRGRPAYAAAKGGLSSLTRQLAAEYGPEVRVNAVVPGPILTKAWREIGEAERERAAAATALRRLGAPEEVAAAVAFLASQDSSFITGVNLVVDGGWSIVKDSM
ncbi:MAG: SDR family NAD(P)-dependent oxidoreductase [Solirubrobacteraceae bacterium]